jgi:hypothetical protein
MKPCLFFVLMVSSALGATAQATSTTSSNCSQVSLGPNGALNGFVPSPDDAWHQNISYAPVDPLSNKIVTTEVQGAHLHADFANPNTYTAGIPYTVVDSSTQPMVPIAVAPGQSDVSVQPIPPKMLIEGNPSACQSSPTGDQHAILFDRHTCVAYEIYQAAFCSTSSPQWSGAQTTIWDFTETEQRPLGWTSADAAGLSVFEGLVRYDEIKAGVINHAIRFTLEQTKNDANGGYFIHPATHAAGTLWGTDNVMGMRFRLNGNFDISGFSPTNQIILTAMKQYGMILADNGSSGYFQGTPDPGWNDDDLAALQAVPLSEFEVVDAPGNSRLAATYTPGAPPLYPDGDVMDAYYIPKGAAPTNSLSASDYTIKAGESVTLTPIASGQSYSYIDNAGFVSGPVNVSPTRTTTYTLYSNNEYGSTASTPVTVTVTAATGTSRAPALKFRAIPTQSVNRQLTVSATSNSPGKITFASLTPAIAEVSGDVVTFRKPGIVRLAVHQAPSGAFKDGYTESTFTVLGESPKLSLTIPDQWHRGVVLLRATSLSYGAITYRVVRGPATVSGRRLTITGTGEVTVSASQAQAGKFAAATVATAFAVR